MCLQTIELSLRVAYHRGPGCAREQHSKSWKLSAVDKHGAAGSIEVDTRPGEYTGSILFYRVQRPSSPNLGDGHNSRVFRW